MEALKVDRSKLMTQTAFAKKLGVSPAYISKLIKEKTLEKTLNATVVKIDGATLIMLT